MNESSTDEADLTIVVPYVTIESNDGIIGIQEISLPLLLVVVAAFALVVVWMTASKQWLEDVE